ncbi:MAG: hypothetical protein WBW37_18930, partial [Methyloceanibacter sp.]
PFELVVPDDARLAGWLRGDDGAGGDFRHVSLQALSAHCQQVISSAPVTTATEGKQFIAETEGETRGELSFVSRGLGYVTAIALLRSSVRSRPAPPKNANIFR